MKQMNPQDMLDLSSGQIMMIIDECRQQIRDILGELTQAINNYHTMQSMLPLKLAAIKKMFLDLDYGRNESMDRAMATQEYMDEINKLNMAHDLKTELELKYEVALNSIKAVTSLVYLKNTELKVSI